MNPSSEGSLSESESSLTISVAVYNPGPEVFKKCLIALKKFTPHLKKIILVDNASSNSVEIASMLYEEFTPDTAMHIRLDSCAGTGSAHNEALKYADTEFFAVISSDIEFQQDWSTPSIEILLSAPDAGQVSPHGVGSNMLNSDAISYFEHTDTPDFAPMSCFVMRTDVAKRFSLFGNVYKFAIAYEDADLSLTLRKNGYSIRAIDIKLTRHGGARYPEAIDICGHNAINVRSFKARWNSFLTGRSFGPAIIVRRTANWEDVFLTQPVLKALKEKYEGASISLMTKTPHALLHSIYVDEFISCGSQCLCDIFIDLDYAYETRRGVHIVDAYAERAGVTLRARHAEVYVSDEDVEYVQDNIMDDGLKDFIAIDLSDAEEGRQWPEHHYRGLVRALRDRKEKVVGIGSSTRLHVGLEYNFVNLLTTPQSALVISRAKVFIGPEGLLAQMAQAVGTPGIVLYGPSDPGIISDLNDRLYPVVSPVVCAGCRDAYIGGASVLCEGRNFECMERLAPEMVIDAYGRLTAPPTRAIRIGINRNRHKPSPRYAPSLTYLRL
ncbi:MAG: glycosyltransferase [Nitrospirae bacterium]|nr:glycosyltransferase [Nitrospirota bacterium]